MPQITAYVDTSLLALRYLEHPDSPYARRLLREHKLVTSAITSVELVSVLKQRFATGDLTADAEEAVLRRIGDDEASWDRVRVSEEVLSRAREVIKQTGLRSLDAIHLATALIRRNGANCPLRFLTRDSGQGAAARALGFEVLGLPRA